MSVELGRIGGAPAVTDGTCGEMAFTDDNIGPDTIYCAAVTKVQA